MKRIKIIFLHWALVCGGAESALYDLVSLLDRNRFDITIFTVFGGGEWEWRFKNIGVTVINSYSCIEQGKTIYQKIKNRLKGNRIAKILKQGGAGLLQKCTQNDYDIIVSFHLGNGFSDIGLSSNAKTIRYIHGDVDSNPELKKDLESCSLLTYDKVICVSEYARQSVYKCIGKYSNICVCHNPINSDKIHQLACEPISIQGTYICSVGRLTKAKGYVRLISLFHQLKQNRIECKLVIVGEGPERINIENAINNLNLQDDVILIGFTENPYPYIKNSLFTVCSSYTEGLHLVSMESLCLGIPVLSIFPTVRELFGDDQCGMIVDTEADLLDGMRRMLTDKAFYSTLKSAAERRSSEFNSKLMVKKVEKEYLNTFYEL